VKDTTNFAEKLGKKVARLDAPKPKKAKRKVTKPSKTKKVA